MLLKTILKISYNRHHDKYAMPYTLISLIIFTKEFFISQIVSNSVIQNDQDISG